jgi:sortase (surface protein transpeptidase)
VVEWWPYRPPTDVSALRRLILTAALGTLSGTAVLGVWWAADGTGRSAEHRAAPAATTPALAVSPSSPTPHPALSSYRSSREHSAVAVPVRLRIPSIEVDSGLETLRRAADNSIEVPRQPGMAGWWADGPRPGQPGPAVVLGHVDSRYGPAVFFRLDQLRAGDEVLVERADSSTVRFVVTELHPYRKDQFPTELVYYPTLKPELRLVTCGGPVDPSTGHYRDNLVVFTVHAP